MFKRGDIVIGEYTTRLLVVLSDNKCQEIGGDAEIEYSQGAFFTPYTGPVYEKDGKRFVPSGEFRIVCNGEYYLGSNSKEVCEHKHDTFTDVSNAKGYRPILLPIPELPNKHEFKAGDWVRYKETGKSYQVSDANAFAYSKEKTFNLYEKLPGRPLTTDDLMQVLSGKKVMVECHACECKSNRGEVYFSEKCDGKGGGFFHENFTSYGSEVIYRHDEDGRVGMPGWYFARFTDGSIVFADGVEGNIFVVDE
jgi:hypothetical protein